MTFARDIKDRRAGEGAGAFRREAPAGPCQGTKEGRVIRLGAAGREMSSDITRETGALAHSQDGMALNLDSRRRRASGGELRVEDAGNPISAFCREGGGWIKQAEIARMGEVDDAVLHPRDHPGNKLLERSGGGEV